MKKFKYKINKGLIVQKIEGNMVIFDGNESFLYTFNETASYIFSLLKKGLDEKGIVDKMVKSYGITAGRAEKDVKATIGQLFQAKIIS